MKKPRVMTGVVLLVLAGLFGAFFLGGILPAQAQPPSQAQPPALTYIYSVNFTCVNEVGPATVVGVEGPLEPAAYRTAINIHNFHDKPAKFRKKAVLARSEDEERGIYRSG